SLVGPEYYAALGRNAYARLSDQPSRAALRSLFGELAGRFPEFVRVLTEISAQELFRREQDTLRLSKRWLHTRGRREAHILGRWGFWWRKWLRTVGSPPGRQTRHASATMRVGSGTTLTTWKAITQSKLLSGNLRASASPCSSVT